MGMITASMSYSFGCCEGPAALGRHSVKGYWFSRFTPATLLSPEPTGPTVARGKGGAEPTPRVSFRSPLAGRFTSFITRPRKELNNNPALAEMDYKQHVLGPQEPSGTSSLQELDPDGARDCTALPAPRPQQRAGSTAAARSSPPLLPVPVSAQARAAQQTTTPGKPLGDEDPGWFAASRPPFRRREAAERILASVLPRAQGPRGSPLQLRVTRASGDCL